MSEVTGGRRLVSAGVAVLITLSGSMGSARADDGIGGFFQRIFGGAPAPSASPLPQPDYADPSSPPLTVRARKHRRPTGAQLAGRPSGRYSPEELKNVTIYTDKTLVRGDAVMTPDGVRIFNGPSGTLHAVDDFVALSSTATKVPKSIRKELTAIDVAARTDFRGD